MKVLDSRIPFIIYTLLIQLPQRILAQAITHQAEYCGISSTHVRLKPDLRYLAFLRVR